MVIYGWLMRFFLVIGNCPCRAGGAFDRLVDTDTLNTCWYQKKLYGPRSENTQWVEKRHPQVKTHMLVSKNTIAAHVASKSSPAPDGGYDRYRIRASGYRLFTKVTTAIVDRHIQWQIDCFLIHKESQIWIKYSSSGFRRASQDAGRRMMVPFC